RSERAIPETLPAPKSQFKHPRTTEGEGDLPKRWSPDPVMRTRGASAERALVVREDGPALRARGGLARHVDRHLAAGLARRGELCRRHGADSCRRQRDRPRPESVDADRDRAARGEAGG